MKIYFVYKFTIKGTGFYYFGVTEDIDRRKKAHMSLLKCIIAQLKYKVGSYKKSHEGYYMVARTLIKGKRAVSINENIAYKVCEFKVLDVKDTPHEASVMETTLIRNSIDDLMCFNKAKYSCYPKFGRSKNKKTKIS